MSVFSVTFPGLDGPSIHNEIRQVDISSTKYTRDQPNPTRLQQTPSIVINSPPSNGRGVLNLTDLTPEEPSPRGEHSKGCNDKMISERNENPNVFRKPCPQYRSHDGGDVSRKPYLEENASVYNNEKPYSCNQPYSTNTRRPRPSQSDNNLKSKCVAEQTSCRVLKTLSDPITSLSGQMAARDVKVSPQTKAERNVFSLKSPEDRKDSGKNDKNGVKIYHEQSCQDASHFVSKHSYRHMNKGDLLSDRNETEPRQLYEGKYTKHGSGNALYQTDMMRNEESHNDNNTGKTKLKTDVKQGEIFGGLLGETDAKHSREYYDRMISKINEQIDLAVTRNRSPYAAYGLGSDDDDDWC